MYCDWLPMYARTLTFGRCLKLWVDTQKIAANWELVADAALNGNLPDVEMDCDQIDQQR